MGGSTVVSSLFPSSGSALFAGCRAGDEPILELRRQGRYPQGRRPFFLTAGRGAAGPVARLATAGGGAKRIDSRESKKETADVSSSTHHLKWRSAALTDGASRAPARAMLRATGLTDEDLRRPLIGIANTWIEIGPCNYHLRELAGDVKAGVRKAGGTPLEFNTISISDGITMGSEGMRASLVSREVITDSIELVTRGNLFDGLVVLVGCDKTIPAGVDGAGAARRAGHGALRRIDCARPVARPRRHHPGRLRSGRRQRGGQHERRRPRHARAPGLSGRRCVRRPVHGQHDGDGVRDSSESHRSAARACRRWTPRRRPSPSRPAP